MNQATVVITTRNRKEELSQALASVMSQDVPLDVLVIDDGSTDGTSDMIAAQFPAVVVHRDETSQGYIVQRNRAAAIVTTPYIVSIDDDAVFTDPGTVRQALAEIEHPKAGALAMPFIDVKFSDDVRQCAPDADHVYVRQWFIGTAHVLKTELFRRLGGYREVLYSQFEEVDFCLRMLEAGYVVRVGRTPPIHHMASPKRLHREIVHYGERNQLLLTSFNVPAGYVPLNGVRLIKQGLQRGLRNRTLWPTITGLAHGCVDSIRHLKHRHPVSDRTYRRWAALGKSGDRMTLEQLEAIT